jgi:hypothetical protein
MTETDAETATAPESETGGAVLIATIGERDPDGTLRRPGAGIPPPLSPDDPIDQPTGPLLCARVHRPGAVELLATEGVRRPAELTRDRIAAELGVTPAVTWLEGDHASFDDMQGAVERALRVIRRELPEGARVVVCPSSGTPQMGQALTIVAMFLFPTASFVQALDPRYVPTGASRLRPVDPRATRVRFDLERAARALVEGHWAVAADILMAVRSFESRVVRDHQPTVLAAWRLALGIRRAEELDYAGAAHALEPQRGTGFRAELDRLKQWYARLDGGGQGHTDRPRELVAMTERQRRSGALSRATVTAAMAWETTLTVALRTRCGLNPDTMRPNDLARLSEEVRERVREVNGRRRLEGQRLRRQALEELDATARRVFAERGAALDALVEMRNQLVHAGTLTGYVPDAVIGAAVEALDTVFAAFAWESWRTAPTAPGPLRALVERMTGAWLPGASG